MQMLYCFVNNIHVDYAELMWEGIYYLLHHPVTSIPYPRFTKIIISHYMTIFPDISRRARDAYHNLQDDDIMKNIFNSGRNKNKVRMRIPAWMITDEMKLTEHYKMYAEVFGLDVPLTQSQPTESTQGTHRTLSAPRSPNPATETAESSVPKRSTVIRFRLPSRQSARLTPPVPVPTAEKADEMILQDMIQVSLAEHKSHEEQEARENVALVYEHLAAEEIEKLVEESENVDDSSPPRHDDTSIPGTRSPRNLSTLVSLDTEKLQELTVTHPTPSSGSSAPKLTKTNRLLSLIKAKPNRFKRYKSFFHELQGRYGYLFAHLKKTFMPQTSSDQLVDNLHDVMMETLPSLVKEKVTEQVKKEVPAQISSQIQNAIDNVIPSLVDASVRSYMSGHILHVHLAQVQSSSVLEQHQFYLAMKADPLAKRHKTSEYKAYVSGVSSSRQVNVEETCPSTSGNQEQDDEFDFWTDSYASDDDEIPTKQVTQDIIEEISLTVDKAKLKTMADEMLRQRCTSGDEHQYHIDQMKNFLQSDIV
ncbi:hypothetical protein Tco_0013248 [Tanacetum coccineum]